MQMTVETLDHLLMVDPTLKYTYRGPTFLKGRGELDTVFLDQLTAEDPRGA